MTAVKDGWIHSSYSGASNCVEIKWQASSKCADKSCVQVAANPTGVRVRDSKDPDGPVLTFTPDEWQAFTTGVRDGEFDYLKPT